MSYGVSVNWRNHEGRTSGLSFCQDTLPIALAELHKQIHYYETECDYREFQIQVYRHCDKCGGSGGKTIGKRTRRYVPCKHCKHGVAEILAEYVYKTPSLLPSAVQCQSAMSGERVYVHPKEGLENYTAVYVRLPLSIQRPIEGGCTCTECRANPADVPAWDTLVIPLDGKPTWTVHWPELERSATLLVQLGDGRAVARMPA